MAIKYDMMLPIGSLGKLLNDKLLMEIFEQGVLLDGNLYWLTFKDAVCDLKKAFDSGLLPNSLEDERYFNIKRMQSLSLQ